jgi:hypothetical protein
MLVDNPGLWDFPVDGLFSTYSGGPPGYTPSFDNIAANADRGQ